MKFSIIFVHFKTGKMSAYTVAQILKHKGDHEIEILICDNNAGDGSVAYLESFKEHIKVVDYPKDKLQSHGIGYDVLFELAQNEWVICMESDSYPTKEGWLDYYVRLINEGYDGANSLLTLSGGIYGHPAGGLYKRSIWVEAWKYCKEVEYFYFPNIAMKEAFACHAMVHHSIINQFLTNPDDYIELADGYKPYYPKKAEEKCVHYLPTVGPMHNGMGRLQESLKTYGARNPETEVPNIILDNRAKVIYKIGYEPGQHHYYWQLAKGYKIYSISTEVKWLEGKEGQQQEYTLTENGVKHCWGISAYHGTDLKDGDVAKIKQSLPEELYETLPPHQKIQI